ncbi:MAG: ABC transporter permease, partial [Fusobacterium sp.]|nr:ABC transporter permease [Fusobacterium sp.]
KKYKFKAKENIALDGAPRYIALNNHDVDVIDAFSTDGLLKKFDLVILEDNLKFFPPYYVAPIIRNDALKKFPEIIPLLDKLVTLLTDEIMIELNYNIDELHREAEEVAREFLLQQNLIENQN